jgi:hypothetical protein
VVFKATFKNISVISWQSDLLEEETGVPWENHRSAASHWHDLSCSVKHSPVLKIYTLVRTSCGRIVHDSVFNTPSTTVYPTTVESCYVKLGLLEISV